MAHKLTVSDNNKPLFNIIDEENQAPSFRHFSLNLNENHLVSPSYHGSRADFNLERVSPWLPQSPVLLSSRSTVWTPSSHSSLHYCCISSLHLDGDIYSMAVSKELVLTGSCSRRIPALHPLDCHTKGYIHASSGEVRAMVAHGDLLFTSHKDHKVRIWNVKSCCGACIGNNNNNNNNNSFKPKKVTTLPSASHFKNFVSKPITSTPHYKAINKPIIASHHRNTISCMAYYHVEGILYTGSYDRTVKAWRVNQKKCVDSFIAHVGNVTNMVVDQLNGYLFTCSLDGALKMWMRVVGANSHALIKVLAFHTHPIHALALSVCSPSQESFLYSGSSNGSINFWEQGLSCRYTHCGFLQGHRFAILCLATLENFVISGSEDSTIRIWKRQIGGRSHECLAILEGHRGPVKCLATHHLQKDKFASSFLVYSSSSDQTFKVWKIKHLPSEIRNYPFGDDDKEDDDRNNNHPDFKPTPVLSPSWVKKKLQCRSVHRSS